MFRKLSSFGASHEPPLMPPCQKNLFASIHVSNTIMSETAEQDTGGGTRMLHDNTKRDAQKIQYHKVALSSGWSKRTIEYLLGTRLLMEYF